MIYGESVFIQYENFLFAVGFGVIAGIIFNLYNMFVGIFNIKKVFLIVTDIILMIILSVLTYLFLLTVNYGRIRLYLVFGMIAGIFVYSVGICPYIFNAFGRLFGGVILSFNKKINKIIAKLKKLTKKTRKYTD